MSGGKVRKPQASADRSSPWCRSRRRRPCRPCRHPSSSSSSRSGPEEKETMVLPPSHPTCLCTRLESLAWSQQGFWQLSFCRKPNLWSLCCRFWDYTWTNWCDYVDGGCPDGSPPVPGGSPPASSLGVGRGNILYQLRTSNWNQVIDATLKLCKAVFFEKKSVKKFWTNYLIEPIFKTIKTIRVIKNIRILNLKKLTKSHLCSTRSYYMVYSLSVHISRFCANSAKFCPVARPHNHWHLETL